MREKFKTILFSVLLLVGINCTVLPIALAETRCERSARVGAVIAKLLWNNKFNDLETIHSEIEERGDDRYYGILVWEHFDNPHWQSKDYVEERECFRKGFLKNRHGLTFDGAIFQAILRSKTVDLRPIFPRKFSSNLQLIKLSRADLDRKKKEQEQQQQQAQELVQKIEALLTDLLLWRQHATEVNRIALKNAFSELTKNESPLCAKVLTSELAKVGLFIPAGVDPLEWFDSALNTNDLYDLRLMSSVSQMVKEMSRIDTVLQTWEQKLNDAKKLVQAELVKKLRKMLPSQWSWRRWLSKKTFLISRYESRKLIFAEASQLMTSLDLENKDDLLRELKEGRAEYVVQESSYTHNILKLGESDSILSKMFINRFSKMKPKGQWKVLSEALQATVGSALVVVDFTKRGTAALGYGRGTVSFKLSDGRGFQFSHPGHMRQGTTVPLQNHSLEFEFDFPLKGNEPTDELVNSKNWQAPFLNALEVAIANDSTLQQRLSQGNGQALDREADSGVRVSCEDELLNQGDAPMAGENSVVTDASEGASVADAAITSGAGVAKGK